MSSTENQGLSAYIDSLTNATKTGKIDWKSVNPTTFVWESIAPSAKVSLQRVERTVNVSLPPTPLRAGTVQQRREVFFLFQVFDTSVPLVTTPILSVDSSHDQELNAKFTTLFDLIKTGVSEKTLEFLRSILPQ